MCENPTSRASLAPQPAGRPGAAVKSETFHTQAGPAPLSGFVGKSSAPRNKRLAAAQERRALPRAGCALGSAAAAGPRAEAEAPQGAVLLQPRAVGVITWVTSRSETPTKPTI